MAKKTLLLLGSEGGLGRAVYQQYSKDYNILTCARDGESVDFKGDLSDQNFLEAINKEVPNPDAVINCCGVYTDDFLKNFFSNVFLPVYTTHLYYRSMQSGTIINIGSQARYAGGQIFAFMNSKDLYYSFAKKVAGEFSEMLSQSDQNKAVRVSLIEPEYLEQGMHGQKQDTHLAKVNLIDYQSIVNAIDFCLTNQVNGEVSQMRIRNIRL